MTFEIGVCQGWCSTKDTLYRVATGCGSIEGPREFIPLRLDRIDPYKESCGCFSA